MAKQSRFKEATLAAQEKEAAESEGKTQAMLFAMLQEQHDKQIATMAANNKANMDAMMERMNAIVGVARGGNKENSPPNSGANKAAKSGGQSKRVKNPRICAPTARRWWSIWPNTVTSLKQIRTRGLTDGYPAYLRLIQLDINGGPIR